MRVLGLIPARGGSKGIPGKNARLLGGRPLLAWTARVARAAQKAGLLDRVILSTEDAELASLGRDLELEVPFLRPPELAQDDTPTLPVMVHALDSLEAEGERFDAVCLLQPTTPFRRLADLEAAVHRFHRGDVDTVVSMQRVPHEHHPSWVWVDGPNGLRLADGADQPIPRRQDLPPAYHRDGSIYLVRAETLRSATIYGPRLAMIEGDPNRHVNLDHPDDWARAEALLAANPDIGTLS